MKKFYTAFCAVGVVLLAAAGVNAAVPHRTTNAPAASAGLKQINIQPHFQPLRKRRPHSCRC